MLFCCNGRGPDISLRITFKASSTDNSGYGELRGLKATGWKSSLAIIVAN